MMQSVRNQIIKLGRAASLLALGAVLAACAVRSQEGRPKLLRFEENGLWGFKDASGNVVLKPRYLDAYDFLQEGIAAVADEKGWSYIDEKGNVLIRPFLYDNGPDYFKDGLARYEEKGKLGYFDTRGKVAIKARFDFALPFENGRAEVCQGCVKKAEGEQSHWEGGLWGAIDKTGALVVPLTPRDGAPALAPCPEAPHCVSSLDTNAPHAAAPFAFDDAPAEAWSRLRKSLSSIPRLDVADEREGYVHAVATSRFMRYKDDVEFRLDAAAKKIDVRSCSRVGWYDFGANRRRVERLRRAFNQLP